MGAFLYFLPGVSHGRFDDAELARHRLAHASAGKGCESRQTGNGPGSQGGLIVVPQCAAAPTCHYKPLEQEWRKAPASAGNWWVGWERAKPPTPADLLRGELREGTAVKLRDGHEWVIPRVHAVLPDRPITIPFAWRLDAEGQWAAMPAKEYRAICEEAYRFWQSWLAPALGPEAMAAAERFSNVRGLELAVDALAVNYRLSRVEASELELLTDDEVAGCLRAVVDADEFEAHAKKNWRPPAPDAPATGSGASA